MRRPWQGLQECVNPRLDRRGAVFELSLHSACWILWTTGWTEVPQCRKESFRHLTRTPFCPGFMPSARCRVGDSSFCHSMPSAGKPVYRPLRAKSSMKWWITGGGMTYPAAASTHYARLFDSTQATAKLAITSDTLPFHLPCDRLLCLGGWWQALHLGNFVGCACFSGVSLKHGFLGFKLE